MIFYLFVLLCMMLLLSYVVSEYDILMPWNISIAMFLVSTAFAMINSNKWGYQLRPWTVAVINLGLLFFGIGQIVAQSIAQNDLLKKNEGKKVNCIDIPWYCTLALTIVLFIGCINTFKLVYQFSMQAGNTEGYRMMLKYVRKLVIQPGFSMGKAVNHLSIFSKACAILYIYALVTNFVNKTCKIIHVMYVMPVILYFVYGILGTGRTFVIELLAIICSIYLISKRKSFKNNLTFTFYVICIGIAAIILFFAFFSLLGLLTGKTQTKSVFDMISLYTGLSIPSFDTFLQGYSLYENYSFGGETLYGVFHVLRKFGFEFDQTIRHLEFVNFNGTKGNVYTSFRRYINDYGYIGFFVIQTYLGMFYTLLYKCVKKSNNGIVLIFYSMLMYPLVMQGIDELLFSSFVGTATVYLMIYIGILYYFLVYKNKKVI